MRSRVHIGGALLVLVGACGGRIDGAAPGPPGASTGSGVQSGVLSCSVGTAPASPPNTEPTLLISGQPGLSTLLIDDVNVYWLNFGPRSGSEQTGAVKSVRKSGGGFATQYSGPTSDASLWLDRGSLYFARPDGVSAVAVTGGAVQVVAGVPKGVPFGVAGGAVYWFEPDEAGAAVRKLTLPHGAPVRLALPDAGRPFDVKAPIVLGPGALYAHDDATLVRIPLDGSPITRTETPLFKTPQALFAVDAHQIYALAPDGIDVQAIAGGEVDRLASAKAPMAIALDDASVYFSDQPYDFSSSVEEGTRISKVSKCGGAVTVRASGVDTPEATSIAVDATNVFSVGVGTVIARIPK